MHRAVSFFALERNVAVFSFTSLFGSLFAGATGFMPIFYRQSGAPLELLGVIASITTAVTTLIYLAAGYWADVYGRKRLIIVGGSILASALFLIAFANLWYIGLLLFTISSAGNAVYIPAVGAMVAETVPTEKRATAFSSFNLISGIGPLFAPILAGFLWTAYGYPAAFVAGGLALAIMTMLRWRYLVETKHRDSGSRVHGIFDGMRLVWQTSSSVKIFMVAMLVFWVSISSVVVYVQYGTIGPYLLTYLKESLHLDELQIGAILTFAMIGGMAALLPGGKMSDRMGRMPFILMLPLVEAVSLVVFPSLDSIGVLLLFLVVAPFLGLTGSSIQAFTAELVPTELRGMAMGIFQSINGFGSVAGLVIASLLLAFFPLRMLFYFAAAGSILVFFLMIPLNRQAMFSKAAPA